MDTLEYIGNRTHQSRCGVEVHGNLVMVTELADNPGTSVTNAAAQVASEVCRRYGIEPSSLVMLEHYPDQPGISETFSLVDLDVVPGTSNIPFLQDNLFENPRWRHIPKEHVKMLMKGDVSAAIEDEM